MAEPTPRKARLPLAAADRLAAKLLAALAPGCDRLEVAGSVRRRCAVVGDLELVAVPRAARDLFGEPAGSALDPVLEALCAGGRLRRVLGGDRYRKYELPRAGVCLDLFLVRPEAWGLQLMLRTGPAGFSHRLVTRKGEPTRDGPGLLPEPYAVHGGSVWDGAAPVPTPEEADVWRLLGLAPVPPEERR